MKVKSQKSEVGDESQNNLFIVNLRFCLHQRFKVVS